MAYDLEEQDQIEGLKAFWKQYGNFILTALLIVFGALAAYRAWGWYQGNQAVAAATVYAELEAAAERKDVPRVKEAAGVVFEKYSGTVYAQMAALVAAKSHVDAGDLKAAKAPLQWAAENAQDAEFKALARIRLAGILLDEKSFDEALEWVAGGAAGGTSAFEPLLADRRGDILLAQGKRDEARTAYRGALDRLPANNPARRLVQLKLDSLGGSGS